MLFLLYVLYLYLFSMYYIYDMPMHKYICSKITTVKNLMIFKTNFYIHLLRNQTANRFVQIISVEHVIFKRLSCV